MESQEYNKIIKEGNVLDFSTLSETKKQLGLKGLVKLESQVDRILSENKITKPELHNRSDDEYTDFYLIDLSPEQIEEIIDVFCDLEVSNLGVGYESTYAARHYAKMLDKWNDLPDFR